MTMTKQEALDLIKSDGIYSQEVMDALQEPCEDEYIKVPKKALKYRTAGMVAYNAEWLKNHFDIERVVICGAQEPCDDSNAIQHNSNALNALEGDAISRQAVLEQTYLWSKDEFLRVTNPFDYLRKRINDLPSVNPQELTGHWIDVFGGCECSECGCLEAGYSGYCPNCGIRMESEDKG